MTIGSPVLFDQSMISDWGFMQNGQIYGYYTARVLVERMSEAEAAAYRELLSSDPMPAKWQ